MEAGVGTGSWGGTCHVATSAVVDCREQGTYTDTVAVTHAATQAGETQHCTSFQEVASYCDWWKGEMARWKSLRILRGDLLAFASAWPPDAVTVDDWRQNHSAARK